MITVTLIVLCVFIVRGIQLYLFLKKVSELCNIYDWKHADKHGFPAIEILEKNDYYMTSKWSAYNFLFIQGPDPMLMFFSLKPLRIEEQYNKYNTPQF